MDLSTFSNSEYMNLLPESEQNFLLKNGRFRDPKRVKDKLKKHYYNVSFRGRGKNMTLSIGKLRLDLNTKLENYMAQRILVNYEEDYPYSRTKWFRQMGLDYDYRSVLGVFKDDDTLDLVDRMTKARTEKIFELHSLYLNSLFTRVFTKVANTVGDGVQMVWEGGKYVEIESDEDKEAPFEKWQYKNFTEQEMKRLDTLKSEAIKASKVPWLYRHTDTWKDGLEKLDLVNVWQSFTIKDFDSKVREDLVKKFGKYTLDRPKRAYNREFTKHLERYIDKHSPSSEKQELYETGAMSGFNTITMRKWHELETKI